MYRANCGGMMTTMGNYQWIGARSLGSSWGGGSSESNGDVGETRELGTGVPRTGVKGLKFGEQPTGEYG